MDFRTKEVDWRAGALPGLAGLARRFLAVARHPPFGLGGLDCAGGLWVADGFLGGPASPMSGSCQQVSETFLDRLLPSVASSSALSHRISRRARKDAGRHRSWPSGGPRRAASPSSPSTPGVPSAWMRSFTVRRARRAIATAPSATCCAISTSSPSRPTRWWICISSSARSPSPAAT